MPPVRYATFPLRRRTDLRSLPSFGYRHLHERAAAKIQGPSPGSFFRALAAMRHGDWPAASTRTVRSVAGVHDEDKRRDLR